MSHTPSTLSAYLRTLTAVSHNGCTNDKFLSPKIGVSCWIRTSARDPTLIVRMKNRTPLYLRHNCLVDRRGIEPRTVPCKGTVFPVIPSAQTFIKPTTVYRHSRDKSLMPSWCCHNRFNKWYSERVSIPLLRLERAAF